MLHRKKNKAANINGITLEWLDQSIRLFKQKGFHFIDYKVFKDCLDKKKSFPAKSILVTIDDGYADQVDEITPIFLNHGVKPVIFLITDFIANGDLPWDERIRIIVESAQQGMTKFKHLDGFLHYDFSNPAERKYAKHDFIDRCELLDETSCKQSIDELERQLENKLSPTLLEHSRPASIESIKKAQNKGVYFANHTATHLITGSHSDKQIKKNIERAASFINLHNLETESFAYAVGKKHSIGRKSELVESLGFKYVFNAIEGTVNAQSSATSINRIPYPETKKALDTIASPAAPFKFSESNLLIKINNALKLKFLINYFGGKRAFLDWSQCQLNLIRGKYAAFTKIRYEEVNRVVFFCMGNINRSAMAQIIFTKTTDFPCASFGLKTQINFPPSVEAQRWARSENIQIMGHKTTRLEDFSFMSGDLIVGFEPGHIDRVKRTMGPLADNCQFTLAGLWCRTKIAYMHDPVARPAQYFDRCFSAIQESANALANMFPASHK